MCGCVSGSFYVLVSTPITSEVLVAAAAELSRPVPALAAEHRFLLALSARDWTRRESTGFVLAKLVGFCLGYFMTLSRTLFPQSVTMATVSLAC